MSPLDGAIRNGRHHMQIRVYYEDTDFSGIVYHANYLRFMERGRTNHLRLMGAEQHALFAEAQAETPSFAFVVRSMQIDFLKPARMDDVLEVVTWPVAVKGASITLAQEVRRGGDVLVKAQVRVAFICDGRAQPIPKALRALMKAGAERWLVWSPDGAQRNPGPRSRHSRITLRSIRATKLSRRLVPRQFGLVQ